MRKHLSHVLLLVFLMVAISASAEVLTSLDIGATGDDTANTSAFILGNFNDAGTYQGRTARSLKAGIGDFIVTTIPPNGGTLKVTYYDDATLSTGLYMRLFINDLDGDTWEDVLLGNLPLEGTNQWRTENIPLPKDLYDSYIANQAALDDPADAPWIADRSTASGYQPLIQISGCGKNGAALTGWINTPANVYFDKVEVEAQKVWTLDVGNVADRFNPGNNWLMYINPYDYNTNDWWSKGTPVYDGQNARIANLADGKAGPFVMTIDPDSNWMSIKVYDNNAAYAPGLSLWVDKQDGGSWQDTFLMNVPLDGSGGWKTIEAQIPSAGITADAAAPNTGANIRGGWLKPGKQALIRIWSFKQSDQTSSGFFTGTVPFDRVTVASTPQYVPVELSSFGIE